MYADGKSIRARARDARELSCELQAESNALRGLAGALRDEGASIAGRVLSGEELVAEAEIFFAHLDQARSQQMFGDHNFVFSGELKYMLGLAKAAAK